MFMDERINYSGRDYSIPHIAKLLHSARLKADKTQGEFAKYLGISQAKYGRYELGKIKWIDKELIDILCDKFDLPIEKVLIPVSKDGTKRALYNWVRRDDAQPYIQRAYEEWLKDNEQRVSSTTLKDYENANI